MKQQLIGKDAAILSTSKYVTLTIGMVSIMLLSRFRTLGEYGTYSQIHLSVSLVSVCLIPDLASSISYFLPQVKDKKSQSKFISTLYGFSLMLTLIAGVILTLLTPFVSEYFNNPMIMQFRYVLLFLPWTNHIIGTLSNFLIATGQIKKISLFSIMQSISILSSIMLIEMLQLEFKDYMFAYIIIQLIFTIIAYKMVFSTAHKISFSIDFLILKNILKFSVPLGISALVGTLSYNIDTLMIGRFLGTEMLAIYSNAGRELPITIFSASLTAILLPILSQLISTGKIKIAFELWSDIIKLSYIILLFGVAALVVFAPQVITLLYSKEYLLGTNIFRIYAITLIWRGTYFGIILNVTNNSNKILIISVISVFFNIILNYFLYVFIGFTGPALATFLTVGIGNSLQLAFTSKITGIKFKHIFPWFFLLKYLGVNVASGLIVYVFTQLLGIGIATVDIFKALLIGIIWLCIYFFTMKKTILFLWRRINNFSTNTVN